MKLLVGVSDAAFDDLSLDTIAKVAESDPVMLAHVARRSDDKAGGSSAIAQTQQALEARGARVETVVLEGDAADALVEAARKLDAAMIVTRAHDRAPRLLQRVFGDTVTRLIERADRPVLAVRAGEEARGRGVLLASGRPGALVLDATATIAKAARSPVTVLHVVPAADGEPLFADVLGAPEDERAMGAPRAAAADRVVEALRSRGVEAQERTREGIVEEQLAREANEGDHWLLVVRGRSTGRLFRVFLGHSFTEDLVRHVRTSVLIVK